MARRGGALSDSESDFSEDDDFSDVEDEALRRRVREAATGVRRDGLLDHARGAAAIRARGIRGRGLRRPAAAPDAREPDARDPRGVDDEEREVLCAAVSDASAPPRHVPGINSGQIGPELAKLRAAQGEHAEYYTLEHYDRLYGRRRAWARDARGSKVWCKDVHGPGCRECTSCHFCRQKTTDVKTRCQCGEWRKAPPGGRGRGVWCGWCLEMRMGENIAEALADEWRCPVCRDICNCSGANCCARAQLFRQQLTRALQFGWQSVAPTSHHAHTHERARAAAVLQLPERSASSSSADAQIGGGGGDRATEEAAARARGGRRSRAAALREAVAGRLGRRFLLNSEVWRKSETRHAGCVGEVARVGARPNATGGSGPDGAFNASRGRAAPPTSSARV